MLTELTKNQKQILENIIKKRKNVFSFSQLNDIEIMEVSQGKRFNKHFIFAINEYIDNFQSRTRSQNPFF